MDQNENIQEVQQAPQEETPIISLKNINIYQRKILILPQVSMSVRKGEFVYLIGKTGSGKSSILKTLIAEVPAEGEEAYINGYNLLKLKKREIPELRKSLGMVFQDYHGQPLRGSAGLGRLGHQGLPLSLPAVRR